MRNGRIIILSSIGDVGFCFISGANGKPRKSFKKLQNCSKTISLFCRLSYKTVSLLRTAIFSERTSSSVGLDSVSALREMNALLQPLHRGDDKKFLIGGSKLRRDGGPGNRCSFRQSLPRRSHHLRSPLEIQKGAATRLPWICTRARRFLAAHSPGPAN